MNQYFKLEMLCSIMCLKLDGHQAEYSNPHVTNEAQRCDFSYFPIWFT